MTMFLRLELSLQVTVVVAGLPSKCRIRNFVRCVVLPAFRCRVLLKHVGMATIILLSLFVRVLAVCVVSVPRTLVEMCIGPSSFVVALTTGRLPLSVRNRQGRRGQCRRTLVSECFTRCPIESTAPVALSVVPACVLQFIERFRRRQRIIDGSRRWFLRLVNALVRLSCIAVISEPAAFRLTLVVR